MGSRNEAGYYSAIARIDAGMDPKDIAEELELSVNTVRRWKTEFTESKRAGTLAELMNMPDYVDAIADLTKQLPSAEYAEGSANELVNGVTALNILQQEFQDTARYLNTRIKSLAMSSSHPGEIVDLINGLTALQNAFFNKNTTSVNVQNNFGGGAAPYSNFLSDKPNV